MLVNRKKSQMWPAFSSYPLFSHFLYTCQSSIFLETLILSTFLMTLVTQLSFFKHFLFILISRFWAVFLQELLFSLFSLFSCFLSIILQTLTLFTVLLFLSCFCPSSIIHSTFLFVFPSLHSSSTQSNVHIFLFIGQPVREKFIEHKAWLVATPPEKHLVKSCRRVSQFQSCDSPALSLIHCVMDAFYHCTI